MSKKFNVGLVGATGVVGETFLDLMKENHFPLQELRPFASSKSEGKPVKHYSQKIQVLKKGCFDGLDMVFFSSGDDISKTWAPKAAAAGAYAIDNSAAFRMSPEHQLVVPEVNGELIDQMTKAQVIANPNCSTIQLMLPLNALKPFGLKKAIVSSYQAVSGAGKPAIRELTEQTEDSNLENHKPNIFPRPIAYNCIPQIGGFNDDNYTSEEFKIMNESKKILSEPNLQMSAFTVRVPSINTHAEAVWLTLEQEISRDELISALKKQPGLITYEGAQEYDTPRERSGKHEVSVSRIHRDLHDPKTWLMWVVGDNLLKGAALNGYQIAERLIKAQT